MRNRPWAGAALLLTVLGVQALPGVAAAAGYGIYEQGASVLAMAGAGVAAVSDASALFYNPAALTRLEGKQQIYLGGSALTRVTSFAGVDPYPGNGITEEMKNQTFPLPTAYYARRFGESWAAGLSINAPFGLGIEWKKPDQFTGRYIVTKGDLRAVNVGLSGAYAFNPMVSVALGGDVLFTTVSLRRRILEPFPPGGQPADVAEVKLKADLKEGYGWNAAISIAPNEHWRMGVSYRGKVIAKPSGDADFTQIPTGDAQFDAAVAAGLPPDQGVKTVLRFPAIASFGVAWLPERWKFEADAVLTQWSLFTDLPITFDQTPANNETISENYDDTWAIRLGAERRLGALTARLGYYYEQGAAPAESVSPLLPDAARHGVTAGVGFGLGTDKRWTVDLYELALFLEQRDTEGVNRDDFNGKYKNFVNSIGVNVGYHW